MTVSIICAVDQNWAIGLNNELLYKVKGDMQMFRKITTTNHLSEQSNIVVMGSRTFESLKSPLRDRLNVVVSRNIAYKIDEYLLNEYNIILENDLDKILSLYKYSGDQTRELFVIGGSEIYAQSFQYADKIYLTVFHDNSKIADTYFPKEELDNFEIESSERHCDEEHDLEYSFINYVRKEDSVGE